MPLPYGGDPDTLCDIGRGRLFESPNPRWERSAAIVAVIVLVAVAAFLLWPTA
jgi:hypothetical protein